MALLGLDVASRTGWAVMARDESTGKVSVRTGVWKSRWNAKPGEIFADFDDWLYDFIEDQKGRGAETPFKAIAIEAPMPSSHSKTRFGRVSAAKGGATILRETRTTSVKSLRQLYGLASIASGVASRFNIKVDETPSAQWRIAFIGHASSPKKNAPRDRLSCILTGRKAIHPEPELEGTPWLKVASVAMAAAHGYAIDRNDPCAGDAGDAAGVVTWLYAKQLAERAGIGNRKEFKDKGAGSIDVLRVAAAEGHFATAERLFRT